MSPLDKQLSAKNRELHEVNLINQKLQSVLFRWTAYTVHNQKFHYDFKLEGRLNPFSRLY